MKLNERKPRVSTMSMQAIGEKLLTLSTPEEKKLVHCT